MIQIWYHSPMRLITRNTDYAVRALSYIARQDEKVISVSHLVTKLKAPRPFLRKILQILNKRGILVSYKGQGGGFALARKPDEIFLTDLIETLQGEIKFNECLFKKMFCPDIKNCVLKKKIDDIEKYVVSQLKSITIASLSNNGCKNRKLLTRDFH